MSRTKYLNQKNIPILFGFSVKDYMVNIDDVRTLYDNYSGEKYKFGFEAAHSEERPIGFITEGIRLILSKSRSQSKISLEQPHLRSSNQIIHFLKIEKPHID